MNFSLIKKIFLGTSVINFGIVFPTNAWNFIQSEYDIINVTRPNRSAPERVFFFGAVSINAFIFSAVKASTLYAIGGPIATYRILLSAHNANITGDKDYTNAIFYPTFWLQDPSNSAHSRYIIYPLGKCSWNPISFPKSKN